jgi:SAM-dependent methyltransferase
MLIMPQIFEQRRPAKGITFTYEKAGEYVRIGLVGMYRLCAQAIVQALQPHRDTIGTLVDFGCGAGKSTRAAAPVVRPGGTAIGVDISPDMLRETRQFTTELPSADIRFEYRQAEMKAGREVLPLFSSCADALISSCVLQEIQEEKQLEDLFEEFGRVLRPDGYLTLVTLNPAIRDEDYVGVTYADFPENLTRSDNYRKCRSTEAPIVWEKDRHWSKDFLAACAKRAGFGDPCFSLPLADPGDPPYPEQPTLPWKDELRVPPVLVLHARKL